MLIREGRLELPRDLLQLLPDRAVARPRGLGQPGLFFAHSVTQPSCSRTLLFRPYQRFKTAQIRMYRPQALFMGRQSSHHARPSLWAPRSGN